MTELQYDVIENFGYKEFNAELLKDYWAFNDYHRRKFTYSLKDLTTKYQFKSESKLHNIVKNCGHLKFTSLLDCGVCTRAFKIDHRKNINFDKEDWFKEQLICDLCKRLNIDSQMKEQLSNFQTAIPLKQKYNLEPPNKDLNYLEKIFLFIILSRLTSSHDNSISYYHWKDFQGLEANGVEYILKGIIDKGYIFISNTYDDVMLQQNKLREASENCHSYLSFGTLRELNKNLDLKFYNDILVVFPEKYDNKEDWIVNLYNEITLYKINFLDIKDIEEYVITKRLREVYALIDIICRERDIPIKKNNALEIDLLRMLKKYNLQIIWNVIKYQADKAASLLYEIEHNERQKAQYSRESVFSNQLTRYLSYLESNNKHPQYATSLPTHWIYSEIELFVGMSLIGNDQKWDKYTPQEIITLWFESTQS